MVLFQFLSTMSMKPEPFLESKEVQFLGDTVEIPGEVKLAMFADKDGNQYFLAEILK